MTSAELCHVHGCGQPILAAWAEGFWSGHWYCRDHARRLKPIPMADQTLARRWCSVCKTQLGPIEHRYCERCLFVSALREAKERHALDAAEALASAPPRAPARHDTRG